jgi:hypothetical protein
LTGDSILRASIAEAACMLEPMLALGTRLDVLTR